MRRPFVLMWLSSATVTPDARGEIITALLERDDLPLQLPHCTYFYCLVRDRMKMVDRAHKSASVALYDEYVAFRKGPIGDDA